MGNINGQAVTALIDTGATEFNYIDINTVSRLDLIIRDLPSPIHVASVHGTSVID
jgi:predicted aspartyl protease